MNEKIKSQDMSAMQHRLDARNEVRNIRDLLAQTDALIKSEAEGTFRRDTSVASILRMSEGGERDIRELVATLNQEPSRFGALRDVRRVQALVVILERRDDLLRSRGEFERLSERAERAESLPPAKREAETAQLAIDRDYCISNFETREGRYYADRGGRGDKQSVGAMKTPERVLIDRQLGSGRPALLPRAAAPLLKSSLRKLLETMNQAKTKAAPVHPLQPADRDRKLPMDQTIRRTRAFSRFPDDFERE